MELRHLRYFLAIAQTENIRRASLKLHVTQPAITRQLRDLEKELGIDLFQRLSQGLRLTTAGHAYQQDVSQAIAAIEAAGERAVRVAGGEIGCLKIGYLEIAAWKGVVPETFQEFCSAFPSMRLELQPANTARQYEMIEGGKFDGGFLYPFGDLPRSCESVQVRQGNVVLAIPSWWADRFGSTVGMGELDNVPFIGVHREEHPAYHDHLMASFGAARLSPKITQLVHDEGAVLSLVSAGLGVAIVNDANGDRPPAGVRFLTIADYSLPLHLQFVYRSDNGNPALRAFVHILHSHRTVAAQDSASTPAPSESPLTS
jgi:DNA-binding transcriptional LysR family regulator